VHDEQQWAADQQRFLLLKNLNFTKLLKT
jgi:hypothetical protein